MDVKESLQEDSQTCTLSYAVIVDINVLKTDSGIEPVKLLGQGLMVQPVIQPELTGSNWSRKFIVFLINVHVKAYDMRHPCRLDM